MSHWKDINQNISKMSVLDVPDQMEKKRTNWLLNTLDHLIYLLIGPFTALYIMPKFFREIESSLGVRLQQFCILNIIGTVLLWIGLIIAIWCTILMLINRFGSIVPFFKPTKLITTGPYSQVRHPMMWALFIVLFGEVLIYSSPFTLLWLLIWIRFLIIYIGKFEEPYLQSVFGDIYQQYSILVHRWLPKYFV